MKLSDRFEFRSIRQEEADQAVAIEHICFPPNEACSEQNMKARIAKAPELFLVAVDKSTGRIAGFLNGLSTDEEDFRDEFFTDVNLYNPKGRNVMLLGLDVLPEYRRQGLATEIVERYALREGVNNREKLILTCLDSKVAMYEKMGFADHGIANSTWGGEEWHEMSIAIDGVYNIRKMTIEDYDAVYSFWLEIPGMGINDVDDSREGIAKYLQRNPDTSFVATVKNRIVGVILAGHDGRRGFIYHSAVLPEYQGNGIGRVLVDTALAALEAENISKVALLAFSKNESGNMFWEHMGFGSREDCTYRDRPLVEMKYNANIYRD